ncbi:MAG: phage major capsid protein [Gemmataceae bacterium]
MFVQLSRDFLGKKAGERIDLAESDAQALLQSGTATAIGDDRLGPLLQQTLDHALAGVTGQVQGAVERSLKEFAQAQTRSRRHAVPALFGDGANGDPKRTFGRFLLAVRQHDQRTLEEMGSRFIEWDDVEKKTAMSTQTGTTGGYLVPTEFHERIMGLVVERSIVRPRATLIPMAGRSCQIPAIDVVTAPSAGDTALLGGVVARWTEEAASLNETEPTLRQVELTNYELSGYSKVSSTLLADSAIGLETFLMRLFSRAIAWYEDYAFLRGNGVGKPLGILAWPGLTSPSARSTANQFRLADVAAMYAKLLAGGDDRSICWVIHPTVLAQLIQMTGGDQVIFLGNDLQRRPRMKILNYDVEVSEKVPALGSANDVTLGDFQHYLIGDRQQIEIAYSEHVAFLTNQSVWRFVSRVGGQPWLRDKVTLADATSTVSPFIGLPA